MDRREGTTNGSLLCGLIGAGIQRSLSPALQQDEARQHGLALHYQLIDLDASSRGTAALPTLIDAARLMRFAGLNITYPCKQLVIPLLDAVSDEAEAIGAVNTVVRTGDRLVGHNTDGSGWSWGFRRALPGTDLSCVVLLGAGGAGSAIGVALASERPASLRLYDVDTVRAEALAATITRAFPDLAVSAGPPQLDDIDILLNASPAGMLDDTRLPIAIEALPRAMTVFDAIVKPETTPLLALAERCGCTMIRGREMMRGQIGRMVDFFLAAD